MGRRMAGRIGFGPSVTPRAGVRETFRYVAPPSLHTGALWIAAAAPFAAILLLLGAHPG